MANNTAIVKEKKRIFSKPKYNKEDRAILDSLYAISKELNNIHKILDYTTDSSLIDSFIYEIKALNKKYEYYLKLCKEKGLVAKGFNS